MPMPARDHWLAEQWATAFVRSIEDMTGQRTTFEIGDAGAATAELIWRKQAFDLPSSGPLWVGASSTTISEIGAVILRAAGIDDADAATIEGTFVEMLGQAVGTLVRVMSATLGTEVKVTGSDDSAPGDGFSTFEVRIRIGETAASVLYTAISLRLSEAIETDTPPQSETRMSAPPAQAAVPAEVAQALTSSRGRALDMLLDVELPVSVSFGRAQLLLKDVIKLTTGSIVELNRSISEPVDVIVNNCVIARGEVVVIEGNFGVRVQQVVSRQERLRTLR